MSTIRFQRTPLAVAALLLVAAGALFVFLGAYAALLAAGGAFLMLAISMLAGGDNPSAGESDDEVDLSPTVAFGPGAAAAEVEPADKKAIKAAAREAKKRASEQAKFEKQAKADAAKAEKAAAKAEKAAAKAVVKSKKGSSKAAEDAALDEWASELRSMNAEKDAPLTSPDDVDFDDDLNVTPFGLAVETLPETSAPSEGPAAPGKYDITEEIPVVVVPVPTTPRPEVKVDSPEDEDGDRSWEFAAYRDKSFIAPFASGSKPGDEEPGDAEDTETGEAEVVEAEVVEGPADVAILDLPAEVERIFSDEADSFAPAESLKRMADKLHSLSSEINEEWERLSEVFEQRDSLIRVLKETLAENEALKAQVTHAIESGSPKQIEALNTSLEDARAEVSRLYQENRDLAKTQFASAQTAARLREIRFLVASDPSHDPDLLAAIDDALSSHD